MKPESYPRAIILHLQIARCQVELSELMAEDGQMRMSAHMMQIDAARSYNTALRMTKETLRPETGSNLSVRSIEEEIDEISPENKA